jgi:aminopeptidase
MDCYIGVRGSDNVSELSDVPPENMKLYEQYYSTPVHMRIRVPHTKWVVLRYPNASMPSWPIPGKLLRIFILMLCTLDYSRMEEAMKPLVEYMEPD